MGTRRQVLPTPDLERRSPMTRKTLSYLVPPVIAAVALLVWAEPAPAEVWLDGKKVEGEAANVRTLSSPVLRPGDRYTFHVKADWTVKGQTYGYDRGVTLETGAKSRLQVLSGTPVEGR